MGCAVKEIDDSFFFLIGKSESKYKTIYTLQRQFYTNGTICMKSVIRLQKLQNCKFPEVILVSYDTRIMYRIDKADKMRLRLVHIWIAASGLQCWNCDFFSLLIHE